MSDSYAHPRSRAYSSSDSESGQLPEPRKRSNTFDDAGGHHSMVSQRSVILPPSASGDESSDILSFQVPTVAEQAMIQKQVEQSLLKLQETMNADDEESEEGRLNLADALSFVQEGVSSVVDDQFTKCFVSRPPARWNWNLYLYMSWVIGVLFRYLIIFPLRLLALVLGWVVFIVAFIVVHRVVKDHKSKEEWQRWLIRFLCGVFVLSWSGVIRYHGVMPRRQPNQIYVANHTSMIDMIVLAQMNTFSVVGQKHPGWVGLIQDKVLSCLGCIWFNRAETNDRLLVSQKIREHIQSTDSCPLLIFPEGTCVNNEHIVRFRKGAFELGARICPIAIKYNKVFVDAFWNSRKQSFAQHLIRLMTCWAVVCDVWYLEPQTIQPGELPENFASRVQAMIAKKAGLHLVDMDGYMKYFKPSLKFVQERQAAYARQLLRRLEASESADCSPANLRSRKAPSGSKQDQKETKYIT